LPIKFGSDGFRGFIGGDFTYENVARIAAAVTQLYPAPAIPIGYDRRFLSDRLAVLAAKSAAQFGGNPVVTTTPVPSPYLAFCVWRLELPVGIQVTASHNPYYYNGIKLKAGYGGSLQASEVAKVEALANEMPAPEVEDLGRYASVAGLDLLSHYESTLIASAGGAPARGVLADFMHGAAAAVYGEMLPKLVPDYACIRTSVDSMFGGSKPEPLEPLLPELIQRVKDANAAAQGGATGTVGLAFDGDGDRLAVIDETGAYLQSHEIFALLLDFLARSGYEGKRVVTTVSFSSLLGRIAERYGLETIEVPVGFKHVSEEMLKGDVLIGGEESGGAALGHYLPERDALLMALTLLRAKAEAGVTLHEMLRGIYARFGRSEFVHVDVQLDPASAHEFRARIPGLMEVGAVAGEPVTSRSDKDGVKLRTAEGWVLVRASGTEPLARFYAEAGSKEAARRMIEDVRVRLL
jgi:phosphomannomutase